MVTPPLDAGNGEGVGAVRAAPASLPDVVVALASDHTGVALREHLRAALEAEGVPALDLGSEERDGQVDYPDYADRLAAALASGAAAYGVMLCGTGIGASIAVNRHRHLRAALCVDPDMARLARQHNDANVLVLGARRIAPEVAVACLKGFLTTAFEQGRHARRVAKMS